MVALTRLDCMLGSAALMRQALAQAVHHCRYRRAFGSTLAQKPLMQNVLADLALESEAAIALTLRVARAVDRADVDRNEAAFARIATALGKYWICKRAVPMINEAQECLGGAGYVEESNLPRLYREAPLNSIWEGSGNIQCLDVLRALAREPATCDALRAELMSARDLHPRLDAQIALVVPLLSGGLPGEGEARAFVEQLVLTLQAAILTRSETRWVGDAFCDGRLSPRHGYTFGNLPAGTPTARLVERALS